MTKHEADEKKLMEGIEAAERNLTTEQRQVSGELQHTITADGHVVTSVKLEDGRTKANKSHRMPQHQREDYQEAVAVGKKKKIPESCN